MKKKNIVSAVLMMIVLIVAVTTFLAFSKSDYKKNNSDEISYKNLMGILGDSIKNKGIAEINEDEINSLAEIFLKDNIKKDNITLNGVSVEFSDDNIVLHAYVEYNKMNVLLSTKGQIYVKDDYIIYTPKNFIIGKLNLPKRIIMNKLKEKINSDKLKIDENFISAKNDIFFAKIDNIKIKDKKIIVSSKEAYEQFQKLQNLTDKKSISEYAKIIKKSSDNQKNTDNAIKKNLSSSTKENNKYTESNLNNNDNNSVEKSSSSENRIEKTDNLNKGNTSSNLQKNIKNNTEVNNNIENNVENNISKEKNQSIDNKEADRNNVQDNEQKNEDDNQNNENEKPEEKSNEKLSEQKNVEYSLKIMRNDLSKVRGKVTSSEEKQIIDIMYSTVNKLMVDPNYNFWGDAGTVLSIYNSLTNDKKVAFKKIVFSNVNMDNAFQLNDMFQ